MQFYKNIYPVFTHPKFHTRVHKPADPQFSDQNNDLKNAVRYSVYQITKVVKRKCLGVPLYKKDGVLFRKFEKNPNILFRGHALNFFHTQEVPILKQHITSCWFSLAQ